MEVSFFTTPRPVEAKNSKFLKKIGPICRKCIHDRLLIFDPTSDGSKSILRGSYGVKNEQNFMENSFFIVPKPGEAQNR